MSTIRLEDDPARSLQWLVWDEQPQVALQSGDTAGLALVLTWQVNAGRLSPAEAAALLGVTPRTVQERCATYAATANSADLVDRRHFNAGQQTAYRLAAHRPALVAQWVRNLVADESTRGRRLAAQLGGVVDDRTVDRYLAAAGLQVFDPPGLRLGLFATVLGLDRSAVSRSSPQLHRAATGCELPGGPASARKRRLSISASSGSAAATAGARLRRTVHRTCNERRQGNHGAAAVSSGPKAAPGAATSTCAARSRIAEPERVALIRSHFRSARSSGILLSDQTDRNKSPAYRCAR
jgi:hypothetical protein